MTRRTLWHTLALTAVIVSLAVFFRAGRFDALPWHQVADADAPYAAQLLVFHNDGDAFLVHHPGAVIYMIQGAVHRALAFVSPAHEALFHLRDNPDPAVVVQALKTAIVTGRFVALGSIILLGGLVYGLIHALTRRAWVAFLWTVTALLFPQVFFYCHVIRPEVWSLIGVLAVALLCLRLFSPTTATGASGWMVIGMGLCAGLAMLAKVQVAPLVAIGALCMIGALIRGRVVALVTERVTRADLNLNLLLAATAVLVFPAWSVRHPKQYTPAEVLRMTTDFQRLFGSMPDDHFWVVAALGVGLLGMAIAISMIETPTCEERVRRLVALCRFLALFVIGVVASIYLVLAPASESLSGFVANTRMLIYATVCNVTQGSFIENANWSLGKSISKIIALHGLNSRLLGINLLFLVLGAVVWTGGRWTFADRKARDLYTRTLVLFGSGFVMDLFATARWHILYPHYALYSDVLYCLGFACLTGVEMDRARQSITARVTAFVLISFVGVNAAMTVLHYATYSWVADSPTSLDSAWAMITGIVPQFVPEGVTPRYPRRLSTEAVIGLMITAGVFLSALAAFALRWRHRTDGAGVGDG